MTTARAGAAHQREIPVLDRLSTDAGEPCALCTQLARWAMHDSARVVHLCSIDAATVLFSSIVATGELLRHLPPQERDAVIMLLWPSYKALG